MCYQQLLDDEEASKPLGDLLRDGLRSATREGVLAAAIVLAVLGLNGTPAWLIAGAAAGAFLLAILLHQTILVVGIGVRRRLTSAGDATAGPA